MQKDKLTQYVKKAPKKPGVYRFLGVGGKPLYIGKASNLKNRLASYARAGDIRIRKTVEEAHALTWQETDSDIEALITESQLIKKHRPPFNITMRDDKQYAYVAFTKEDFPRIYVTHQPGKTQSVGPFTDAGALRDTLKYLRRSFPYCTCAQKHHILCLNAHIGKCLGVCCLKKHNAISNSQFLISKQQYRKNVRAIQEILSGKRTTLVSRLEKEMDTLARKEEFEGAIALRSKLGHIKRIFENARVVQDLRFKIQDSENNALEQLASLLKLPAALQRVEGYDISNIQGAYAAGAMVAFRDGKPDKNNYRKFRILPNFFLKNLGGQARKRGDTAMLTEVLTRRFRHPKWRFPDLIIVDGGKGQLNAAMAASGKSKVKVIALTKNERHRGEKITFKAGGKFKELPLSKLPKGAKNLILAVDSEAHRFAIGYYRALHRRALR